MFKIRSSCMKYIGSILTSMILMSSFGYVSEATNKLVEASNKTAEQLCKAANRLMTWSPASYEKVTQDGKKILYFLQKPDKHVILVADHGQVSFPLAAGKYRYFEYMIWDQPLKAPMFVQREINFDRWNKLKDCKCNLNCPCWQGLDCTCDCCKANADVGKAARQNPSE